MNPALIGQVGLLLGTLGVGLQFLRAQKGFPEWAFYALAVVFTAGGCWLAMDDVAHITKAFVLNNWPIYTTLLGTTLGGTGTASNTAKGLVKLGFDPANKAIPLTNSK